MCHFVGSMQTYVPNLIYLLLYEVNTRSHTEGLFKLSLQTSDQNTCPETAALSVIHALKLQSTSMAASVYLFLSQSHAWMAGYTALLCCVNGLQLTCWVSTLCKLLKCEGSTNDCIRFVHLPSHIKQMTVSQISQSQSWVRNSVPGLHNTKDLKCFFFVSTLY